MSATQPPDPVAGDPVVAGGPASAEGAAVTPVPRRLTQRRIGGELAGDRATAHDEHAVGEPEHLLDLR